MDVTVNRPRLGDRIEESPVDGLLQALDHQCLRHDQPLRVELAEITAADVYDAKTSIDELTFHELTIWVPHPIDDLIEAMPHSVFAQMPHHYDSYEAVNDEATLRFRFDAEYPTTQVIPTEYEYLQLELPTFEAYMRRSAEHFEKADATP